MNASKFTTLGAAAMLVTLAVQASTAPAMSMPIPIASGTAMGLARMPELIVRAEHDEQGIERYLDGQAAWYAQHGIDRPGYGGYYGRSYGSPYYAPRRSEWCYYHPYQCR
jgi:hypothetical protein